MKRQSINSSCSFHTITNGRSLPILVDTTLRDGEQAPGVVFSLQEKLNILEGLSALGIREVEIGVPAIGDKEASSIAVLVERAYALNMKPICWCRGRIEDLDAAKKTGCRTVHISLPVSKIQIRAMGLTESTVLRKLDDALRYATTVFDRVFVGAQDATRAAPSFLMKYLERAVDGGAVRIRLADTVGIALPEDVAELVRHVKKIYPFLELEYHAHNDFGLAAANALAALNAGADAVSATVLGLGERAGNASLETLLFTLVKLKKMKLYFNTKKIAALCKIVETASGRSISPQQPLVGAAVCTHESGIHVRGQTVDPHCFQSFSSADVGASEGTFLYSKMSGRAAARRLLRIAGKEASEGAVRGLLQRIADDSEEKKRSLMESEAMEMVQFV